MCSAAGISAAREIIRNLGTPAVYVLRRHEHIPDAGRPPPPLIRRRRRTFIICFLFLGFGFFSPFRRDAPPSIERDGVAAPSALQVRRRNDADDDLVGACRRRRSASFCSACPVLFDRRRRPELLAWRRWFNGDAASTDAVVVVEFLLVGRVYAEQGARQVVLLLVQRRAIDRRRTRHAV